MIQGWRWRKRSKERQQVVTNIEAKLPYWDCNGRRNKRKRKGVGDKGRHVLMIPRREAGLRE